MHFEHFLSYNKSYGNSLIQRMQGPFVDNVPHGAGRGYVKMEKKDKTDQRWEGDTAVKGPVIVFDMGKPVDFP